MQACLRRAATGILGGLFQTPLYLRPCRRALSPHTGLPVHKSRGAAVRRLSGIAKGLSEERQSHSHPRRHSGLPAAGRRRPESTPTGMQVVEPRREQAAEEGRGAVVRAGRFCQMPASGCHACCHSRKAGMDDGGGGSSLCRPVAGRSGTGRPGTITGQKKDNIAQSPKNKVCESFILSLSCPF